MLSKDIAKNQVIKNYQRCKGLKNLHQRVIRCYKTLINKNLSDMQLSHTWNSSPTIQRQLHRENISHTYCKHIQFKQYFKELLTEIHHKTYQIAKRGLQFLNVLSVLKYYHKLQLQETNIHQFQLYLNNHSFTQSVKYLDGHNYARKILHLETQSSINVKIHKRLQQSQQLNKKQQLFLSQARQRVAKLPTNFLSKSRRVVTNKVMLMNMIQAQKEHILGLEVAQYHGIKKISQKLRTYIKPSYKNIYKGIYNKSLHFWAQIESQFNDKYHFLQVDQKLPITKSKANQLFTGVLEKRPRLQDNMIPLNCLYWCFEIDKPIIQYLCKRGLIRGVKATKQSPAKIEFIHRAMNDQEIDTSDTKYVDTLSRDIKLNSGQAKKQLGAQNNRVTGITYLNVKKTSYGVYFPDVKRMFYDDKHNINPCGFHFKFGTGRHQLVIFSSPISAISYTQLYKDNASALRDTTFLVLSGKNYNAHLIRKLNDKMHFAKIVLARENDFQSYQLIQAITSQYGERLQFVHNAKHRPQISTAIPVSTLRGHSAWYLMNKKQFNRTWNQELRMQKRKNKVMERPGFELNVDQYGLMTTQQLVHRLSRPMAQVFDAIAQLVGKIDFNHEYINAQNLHIKVIKQLIPKFSNDAWNKVKNYFNYSGKYLPGIDVARYTKSAYHQFYCISRTTGQINPLLATPKMQRILSQAQPTREQVKQRAKKLYTIAMIAMINQEHSKGSTIPLNIQLTHDKVNSLIEASSLKRIHNQAPLIYRKYIKQTPDLMRVQQHKHIPMKDRNQDLRSAQILYQQNTKLLYLNDFLTDRNMHQYHKLVKQLSKEKKLWQKEKEREQLKHDKKHQMKARIATLMSKVPRKDLLTFSKILYSRGAMQRVSSPQLQNKYRHQIRKESTKLSKESKIVMQDVLMNNQSPKYLKHVLNQAQRFAKQMNPTGLRHSHNTSHQLMNGMKSSIYHIKHNKSRHKKQSTITPTFNHLHTQHHSQKWLKMYHMHHQGLSR